MPTIKPTLRKPEASFTLLLVLSVFFGTLGMPERLFASPFLVSDPNPSAIGGFSEITGLPQQINNITPLTADGSVRVDLADLPVGLFNLQVRVCIPEWLPGDEGGNVVCSPFVQFSLRRSGLPSAPEGVKIKK